MGLILDISLTSDEHAKAISSTVSKTIGQLGKLNNRLQRYSLTRIHISIVGPHLDYGGVIFDKVYNNTF